MSYVLDEKVISYLQDKKEETLKLIEDLCKIPAPSGKEERRAEFVKNYLENFGAEGVYIDQALNVLYPVGCDEGKDIVVFMAHTDTVFPDTEYPMPFKRDDKCLYSPGVGDDVTCLAIMITVAKYVTENKLKAPCGVLFAANSCEEGLGNLKGVKQIMKDFSGRVKEVYTFDGKYVEVVNKCVGSHRYELTFETEGGHSFNHFGNRNAIYAMSKLIHELYKCKVPVSGNSKTTYNVGLVSGGTSVNTIAQKAVMTYEYRSDDFECLAKMQEFFNGRVEDIRKANLAEVTVKLIGERPCGGKVDEAKLAEMTKKVKSICEKYSGVVCEENSGSTDCNIPMAMGIPSICVGVYSGSGAHTREERVDIESIPAGLKIAAEIILGYFDTDK